MKNKIAFALLLAATSSHADITKYVKASAVKENESCRTMSLCEAQSNHSVFINNASDRPMTFKYIYWLCAANQKCVTKENTATVQPHAMLKDMGNLKMSMSYQSPGIYGVTGRTQIIGESHEYSDDLSIVRAIYVSN